MYDCCREAGTAKSSRGSVKKRIGVEVGLSVMLFRVLLRSTFSAQHSFLTQLR